MKFKPLVRASATTAPENLRVLWVVPRFHTNLWYAAHAVRRAGGSAEIWAFRRGPTEDHLDLSPKYFQKGVCLKELEEAMREADPHIAFFRGSNPICEEAAELARRLNIRRWRYTMRLANKPVGWRESIKMLQSGMPMRRISPVREIGSKRSALHSRHLPWPVTLEKQVPPSREAAIPTILCVGKLAQPRKNHIAVINAVREHAKAGRARLILAGTDELSAKGADSDYLRRLIAVAEQEPWIEYHINVPFAAMADLYRKSHITILPSFNELLGCAPLEAMAHESVPVISTAAGSSCYIMHHRNGVLIDPDAPETIAAALDKLIVDRDYRERLASEASVTAHNELGEERFMARLKALWSEGNGYF